MISIIKPRSVFGDMEDASPANIAPFGGSIIRIIRIKSTEEPIKTNNDEGEIAMADYEDEEMSFDDIDELDEIPDEGIELDELPSTEDGEGNADDLDEPEELDELPSSDEDIDDSELDSEEDFEGLDDD